MRPHNKAASCRGVLSNSGSSRRFVYRTADAARSEVGCTPGGQPRELVQSSSENDSPVEAYSNRTPQPTTQARRDFGAHAKALACDFFRFLCSPQESPFPARRAFQNEITVLPPTWPASRAPAASAWLAKRYIIRRCRARLALWPLAAHAWVACSTWRIKLMTCPPRTRR